MRSILVLFPRAVISFACIFKGKTLEAEVPEVTGTKASCVASFRVFSSLRYVIRTPFRGLAVNQNSEMRSPLEFFATAHSFCERSLESVNCMGLTLPILLPSRTRWPPVTHMICWMMFLYHLQCAVRQLWKKYGVELHQQCVHDYRRC